MPDQLLDDVERLLTASPEPLPTRALASQLLAPELGREVRMYSMGAAFLPGERIAWDSPVGRLIGDVVTSERISGTWRLIVEWDRKVSPGLDAYLKKRAGVRLSYLFDPTGSRADSLLDPFASSNDGPNLVELLEADLDEQLPGRHGFANWKGEWATWRRLPHLDLHELERSLLHATADDGIAQTNQVVDLLRLPAVSEPGHGFAAMAVNLMVDQRGGWLWGSAEDGGEWLPNNAIALVFAKFGAPPRVEEQLQQQSLPDVAEDELPQPLAEFVADETVKGLAYREHRGPLEHVLSEWERRHGIFVLDSAELLYFPEQARLTIVLNDTESRALVDFDHRMIRPEDETVRRAVHDSGIATFERQSATDVFALSLSKLIAGAGQMDHEGTNILLLIMRAFDDGEAKTPDQVLRHVLGVFPGDAAVVARIVATYLATYACFTSPDDRAYRYDPERAHNPSMPTKTIRVAEVLRRARKAYASAEEQDRLIRQWRLGQRSPHMVRGHMRKLRTRGRASELQLALARRHGLSVPAGSTFVRPHKRNR